MQNSSSNGGESTQVSPRLTKSGNSKPVASLFCGPLPPQRIVGDSYCPSNVDFMMNWFVVAAEDGATVSSITDDSMVEQMERSFALMDSISLAVSFDSQVPSENTTDLPNHALRGDWDSAEHVSNTCARNCAFWSCCLVASPCSRRWRLQRET